ncbi:MAG TPA: N-acetylmuramoyl-L-alanine amidase [Anaerolineae bacterium]|nr:N-acetylmuramoyl-L-alanine amidase [Anaerolineae bacterium]
MPAPDNSTVLRRDVLLRLTQLSRWTAILAVLALVVVVGNAIMTPMTSRAGSPARFAESGVVGQPPGRPRYPRVGLVAGHWGYDSGAVCEDGLTEQSVNFEIARRVKVLLEARRYRVDLLQEFDPRLSGYSAGALVSIHADSCAYINDIATGFKVARSVASYLPEAEDRLVSCLIESYAAATGLGFHANSITPDMTSYHSFSEVAPDTPAAIIEVGFLHLDRGFLTGQPDRAAAGIADGIVCFVED